VLQAALIEVGAKLPLSAHRLVELDEAGVPGPVVDVMVALSFPEKFIIERPTGSNYGGGYGGGGFGGTLDPWLMASELAWLSLYSPFGLENLLQNRAVTKFRITDPTLRTREIRGFVKQLNETFPVQGICQRAVTIRISGAPVDVSADVTLVPTNNLLETAAGGAHTIAVTSASTQAWIAVSNVSWIVITTGGTPTVGDGTVDYTVSASTAPTPARTGVITVGNKSFTVTQAAGV
jgi:hypothetical protein